MTHLALQDVLQRISGALNVAGPMSPGGLGGVIQPVLDLDRYMAEYVWLDADADPGSAGESTLLTAPVDELYRIHAVFATSATTTFNALVVNDGTTSVRFLYQSPALVLSYSDVAGFPIPGGASLKINISAYTAETSTLRVFYARYALPTPPKLH